MHVDHSDVPFDTPSLVPSLSYFLCQISLCIIVHFVHCAQSLLFLAVHMSLVGLVAQPPPLVLLHCRQHKRRCQQFVIYNIPAVTNAAALQLA